MRQKPDNCCHTKTKFLSRELPFRVIWQLGRVDINVVVAVDTFNHLPLYLELGFLFRKRKKRENLNDKSDV